MGFLKGRTFSIRITVVSLFLLLSGLTAAIAIGLQYHFSYTLAEEASQAMFSQVAEKVRERIEGLDRESRDLAALLNEFPGIANAPSEDKLHPATFAMAEAMRLNLNVYALYIGYHNGDFYELINLDSDPGLRQRMGALAEDRWIVIKILDTTEGIRRIFEYYNDAFAMRSRNVELSSYRASVRPWFRQAVAAQGVIKTEPYLFHNLQSPGVTYARRIKQSQHVIAVDISLATLSAFLQKQRFYPHSELFLYESDGTLNAYSHKEPRPDVSVQADAVNLTDNERRYLDELGVLHVANEMDWPPFDFSHSGKPQGYSVELLNLLAAKIGLRIEYSNGYSWSELTRLFREGKLDMLQSIVHTPERESWGMFTDSYISLPTAVITRQGFATLTDIQQLNGKRVAMPAGWALESQLRTLFPDIVLVPVKSTLDALQAVSRGAVDAAVETLHVAQYLMEVYFIEGLEFQSDILASTPMAALELKLMVHSSRPLLASLLNKALQAVTPAEKLGLAQRWLEANGAMHIARSISAGVVPYKELLEVSRQRDVFAQIQIGEGDKKQLGYVTRLGSEFSNGGYFAVVVPIAEIIKPYLRQINYSVVASALVLLLLLPLMFFFTNMIVRPINALALENKKIKERRFDQIIQVSSQITELSELSGSMLSMSKSIQAYQRSQQELMDAFIKVMAQAIDEKSPYTAGHCARVPELAQMLAQAASDSDAPAFKQFKLENEAQWREFKIASWLHDCGKVTTPEHIVDKGSKLETIYNRIHEIRMRFEVLWRDAEVEYWRARVDGAHSDDELMERLLLRQQQIRDDFAFIAECNVGGEFMADEKIERIKRIAAQHWVRHLDDRLGLSPEEVRCEAKVLPVTEPLLADRESHKIRWKQQPNFDPSFGFKMPVPELQANLGEIYNLSIRKGTLTKEDRFRINEHITSTIRMLETLPLPEDLARVPEYAGGHHETLIGTGYPRRLKAQELSIPARILSIADIFEALTAADRPYKRAKTLQESLHILRHMVDEKHIDKELFNLMLSSNIHMEYARKFLKPEQFEAPEVKTERDAELVSA